MSVMRGHEEIFQVVRHEILSGKFDADKRFPSESALAERFGCLRPTISRVTLDLEREGLIITRLRETLHKIGGGAEKMRLAGFDDVTAAAEAGITTVRQPLDDLASTALQTLISRISSPELPPRTILLHAPLVVR